MSKTIVVETPAPRNPLEAVNFAVEPFTRDDLELTSTGGIQNNTKALWAAIRALAVYVDGESEPTQHTITVPDHYVADTLPAESRPAVVPDPERQVVAA